VSLVQLPKRVQPIAVLKSASSTFQLISEMKAAIITDLDGTLIDHHTYSADAASQAIQRARGAGIPICICSSKSRTEILYYRKKLGIGDPFISENGGAVFIPESYFDNPGAAGASAESFERIELGTPYDILVAALRDVQRLFKIRLRGFHEITAEELAKESGLTLDLAKLALDREYDEPFWIDANDDVIEAVTRALRKRSLQVTRGSRFHHVMGNNDKGKAVDLLAERFRRYFPTVVFAGLGDSPNDIPMLRRVDIPILVKTHSGKYDEETRHAVPGVRLADGIEPHGWNIAVNALLSEWRASAVDGSR